MGSGTTRRSLRERCHWTEIKNKSGCVSVDGIAKGKEKVGH